MVNKIYDIQQNSAHFPMKTTLLSLTLTLCSFLPAAADSELDSLFQHLEQCEQTGSKDSIAAAHNDLALYYAYRNADSCLIHCQEGLKYADTNKEIPYIDLLANLGDYYNSTGESEKFIDCYQKVWKEVNRLNCSALRKGEILSNYGVGYRRLNLPDSALAKYKEALEYLNKCKEEACDEIPFLLTNIAILYTNTSRMDEALPYIQQAVDELPKTKDTDTYLYISNTAGAIYTILEKYNEAEKMMTQSLNRAKAENMPRFVLQGVPSLLMLYERTGKRQALEQCIRETETWVNQCPPLSNEVLGYYEQLASIKANMGDWKESNRYFQILVNSHSQNAQAPLQLLYLGMARNYEKLQQNKKAAEYYERAIAAMDSVYGAEIDQQLSEFSTKFNVQKKQIEIAQLSEKNEQQKTKILMWTTTSVVLLFVLVLLFIYSSYRRKRIQQENKLVAARNFVSGLEQERGRLARELHDGVCSDILGIGMMIKAGKIDSEYKKDICDGLDAIHQDVRAISHELMLPKFQYTTLNEVVKEFLSHIKSETMDIVCHTEGKADEWKNIPQNISFNIYRIVQELTNNIIRHSGATQTDIYLSTKEHSLNVLITNNGKAFDKNSSTDGLGMSSTYERAKIIDAQLDIRSEEGKQQFKIDVLWD